MTFREQGDRCTHKEGSSPVDSGSESVAVLLGDGGEVVEPVKRVGKLLDLLPRNTNTLHDLKLVRETGRLGVELTLGRLRRVLCSVRGRGDGLDCRDGLRLVGVEALELGSEHLHLSDELVGGGLVTRQAGRRRGGRCQREGTRPERAVPNGMKAEQGGDAP